MWIVFSFFIFWMWTIDIQDRLDKNEKINVIFLIRGFYIYRVKYETVDISIIFITMKNVGFVAILDVVVVTTRREKKLDNLVVSWPFLLNTASLPLFALRYYSSSKDIDLLMKIRSSVHGKSRRSF